MFPHTAHAVLLPRLTATVLFPTPPLQLDTAMTCCTFFNAGTAVFSPLGLVALAHASTKLYFVGKMDEVGPGVDADGDV